MAGKTRRARERLARGAFLIPSPREISLAQTKRGGFSSEQLAEWGVPWPPPAGWRQRLHEQWQAQGEPEPEKPRGIINLRKCDGCGLPRVLTVVVTFGAKCDGSLRVFEFCEPRCKRLWCATNPLPSE